MEGKDMQQLIDNLTPEIVERLQTAVEIGKWPDGTSLSNEQRESAMQALMLWQARHGEEQHLTVGPDGELIKMTKDQLKAQFDPKSIATLKPE